MRCCFLLLPILIVVRSFGQSIPPTITDSAKTPVVTSKTLDKLNHQYSKMGADINNSNIKLLQRLQRKEVSLYEKLSHTDSAKAKMLLTDNASVYQQMFSKMGSVPSNSLSNYVPSIDSAQTALRFLNLNNLPVGQQLSHLQNSLSNANEIGDFIKQRQSFLENQLAQSGLVKELTTFKTQANAYRQQLAQYKDILNDPSKQQKLLMDVVNRVPAFQKFWQQNSILSQLFPMPGNAGTMLAATGLQSASQVGSLIQQRLGVAIDDGGETAARYLQQQAGDAQGQIDALKDKLDRLKLPGGGSSDMPMPSKAPNSQANKSFLKRLEWGFTIQNSAASTAMPNIAAPGLSVGYKLSDKATVGVGASYLVGLGEGFNHIRISNQGMGLRSFIDIKAKGSFWLTGGWEYNYLPQAIWQKSALFGVSKKFNVGKKSGSMQLLYDVLADREIPRGQALKFRFGYAL